MAQTTRSLPSTVDFKYPPSSLHTCVYCERIVIDPSAPDTGHDRRHATFVNSFKFEYAEVAKAAQHGCVLLQPVLDSIQGPHDLFQDSSQSGSELFPSTLFIDIHVKYQQVKETCSKFAKDLRDVKIQWSQADGNVPLDQGSPVVRCGAYSIAAELGEPPLYKLRVKSCWFKPRD
jgi:hypothetical protein